MKEKRCLDQLIKKIKLNDEKFIRLYDIWCLHTEMRKPIL